MRLARRSAPTAREPAPQDRTRPTAEAVRARLSAAAACDAGDQQARCYTSGSSSRATSASTTAALVVTKLAPRRPLRSRHRPSSLFPRARPRLPMGVVVGTARRRRQAAAGAPTDHGGGGGGRGAPWPRPCVLSLSSSCCCCLTSRAPTTAPAISFLKIFYRAARARAAGGRGGRWWHGIQGIPPPRRNLRDSRRRIHKNLAGESRCSLRRREESKESNRKIHLQKSCILHCGCTCAGEAA